MQIPDDKTTYETTQKMQNTKQNKATTKGLCNNELTTMHFYHLTGTSKALYKYYNNDFIINIDRCQLISVAT